jgi:hypothetical protein
LLAIRNVVAFVTIGWVDLEAGLFVAEKKKLYVPVYQCFVCIN